MVEVRLDEILIIRRQAFIEKSMAIFQMDHNADNQCLCIFDPMFIVPVPFANDNPDNIFNVLSLILRSPADFIERIESCCWTCVRWRKFQDLML